MHFWDRAIECLTGPEKWSYIIIPFMNAIIGWFTNWKAIVLTFYPIKFWGKPPYLGWQGIVPRKAEKMAGMAVDIITTKLLSIDEVFKRIDPKRIADEMEGPIISMMPDLINDTMEEYAPAVWETLPQTIKDQVIGRSLKDSPRIIEEIVSEVQKRVTEVFDLRAMVIDAFKRNVKLLNKIFITVGFKEFQFLEYAGFIFGFPFGLLQLCIWFYYQPWWFLPLGGGVVGFLINWIAIKMIFEPRYPKKIGPFTIHGLFLRRQKEIAAEYGRMAATEILNPQNIVDAILRGPLSDGLFKIISTHVKKAIDKETGLVKPFLQFIIGSKQYVEMKNKVMDRIRQEMPKMMHSVHDYSREALDIENTLREKLAALSVEEFEGILHPVFKEDEWILITLGGVLGFAVGYAQTYLPF